MQKMSLLIKKLLISIITLSSFAIHTENLTNYGTYYIKTEEHRQIFDAYLEAWGKLFNYFDKNKINTPSDFDRISDSDESYQKLQKKTKALLNKFPILVPKESEELVDFRTSRTGIRGPLRIRNLLQYNFENYADILKFIAYLKVESDYFNYHDFDYSNFTQDVVAAGKASPILYRDFRISEYNKHGNVEGGSGGCGFFSSLFHTYFAHKKYKSGIFSICSHVITIVDLNRQTYFIDTTDGQTGNMNLMFIASERFLRAKALSEDMKWLEGLGYFPGFLSSTNESKIRSYHNPIARDMTTGEESFFTGETALNENFLRLINGQRLQPFYPLSVSEPELKSNCKLLFMTNMKAPD